MRGLARAFPEHHRVLAAPAALAPLALLDGAIHHVVPTGELRPLDPSLHHAPVAVNLHGRGPQSHRLLLEARPRRLIAFGHRQIPESRAFPAWRAGEHEVERWCRMLGGHGIATDPSDLYLPLPDRPVPQWALGATVVHPGGSAPARRWPKERWAEVARAERSSGREVIITGTTEEMGLASEVARMAGLDERAVLAGQTDLLQLAALLAAAGRAACGDTGVAHLATALRTPSVVLFGPESPAEWGPPPGRGRHRVLWKGPEGLLSIQVEEVLEAIELLPGPPGRRGEDPPFQSADGRVARR